MPDTSIGTILMLPYLRMPACLGGPRKRYNILGKLSKPCRGVGVQRISLDDPRTSMREQGGEDRVAVSG